MSRAPSIKRWLTRKVRITLEHPGELLSLLEDVANGVEFERKTERQRVTPAWWLHHLGARVISQTIVNGVQSLASEVETSLVEPVVGSEDADAQESWRFRSLICSNC